MEKIEELIGKELLTIGRACNVCWLGFGHEHFVIDHKGIERIVSEYSLHIQCAFRLWHPEKPKFRIARDDIYEPCGGGEPPDNFYWDVQDGNFYDEKAKILRQHLEQINDMIVAAIDVNTLYDLKITFENGFLLETFCDCFSKETELWRLFNPYTDKPHLVVTGTGIEKI